MIRSLPDMYIVQILENLMAKRNLTVVSDDDIKHAWDLAMRVEKFRPDALYPPQ